MADNTTINALQSLNGTAGTQSQQKTKKKNRNEIGQQEFLQLLVTQLKQQDPLDPMKNEEFAVNLAQFSQLEQLIAINDKIGQQSGSEPGSLAAYLGHEVSLNSDRVEVSGGDGGRVRFELVTDASAVKADLIDPLTGSVVETVELGQLQAGKHSIPLKDLNSRDGEYQVKITALGSNGNVSEPDVQVSGVVSGFVPGPEPTLLVGNREVTPGEIEAVYMSEE
ncbi:MAG: hypothetical protein D6719_10855 [Candidatus Dadabacteria bacterium]|nr:MAG: hypothetical protein D6719_10855 [Candidatus Dadabacteria bacterium]